MGLLSISCFSQKPVPSYTYTFFSPVQFLEPLPSPFLSPALFFLPHPRFRKIYPQSKTFLNIRAVPSSAVFCINAVLITTPSSSMQFFSFFDVPPNAPTTTGMNLMLLIFQHPFDFSL